MAPKKPPSYSKSKPPPPPPPSKTTTAHGGASPNTGDVLPQELSVIKRECGSTFTALRRGNLKKAQKLMKEARARHENSPLLHHVQAIVHAKEASLITDNATKQKHLKKAAEFAKQAVSLSPNSLEFAYFYANLLLELSKDTKNFEEVMRECERGLSIGNPIEPDNESLQEVMQLKASNPKALVPNILFQEMESKLAMITTGMKNLEIGDSSEDPMLKIKKSEKTVEERRKAIEVRVAAARLLQENSELLKSQEVDNKEIESNLPTKKRENRKKFLGSGEFSLARKYWKSLSDEEKLGLLKPRLDDVWAYCRNEFEEDSAVKNFLQAIDFFNGARTWKFWECCICYDKFVKLNLLIEHLRQQHASILESAVLPEEISSDWEEKILNCLWKPVDTVAAVKIIENEPDCPNDQKWPLSDDSQRANILERIREVFRLLLADKCLSWSNLQKVGEYTMEELETMVPASKLRVHGLYDTPLCICFLAVSQLKKVLEFLQDIYQACSTTRLKGTFTDDELKVSQEYKFTETIVFSGDTLLIVLDDDRDVDDGSAATITEDELVLDDDDSVYWLFVGDSIGEDLASWESLVNDKQSVGRNIFQFLEKRLSLLESLVEKKCEQRCQEEELLAIKSICIQELKKREQGEEYIPQSFESLLRKRQDEYIQREGSSTADELYVISKVLEAAQKVNSQDLHEKEDCIKNAVIRKLTKRSGEILKIDTSILSNYADMRQMESKFALVSFLDYRIIILPLLKSFMKARLDGLVHKDALEKSEAAREQLLAELELDEEKNLTKASDQTKRTEGKLKDKKKKKSYRSAKDSKVSHAERLQEDAVEEGHFPVAFDDDQVKEEKEELRLKLELEAQKRMLEEEEEELRLKLELEEQERMLEEKLEYQRQIENEAKQKQLAEENKEAGEMTPEKEKETYASIIRKSLS